jgi:hypothetical protein
MVGHQPVGRVEGSEEGKNGETMHSGNYRAGGRNIHRLRKPSASSVHKARNGRTHDHPFRSSGCNRCAATFARCANGNRCGTEIVDGYAMGNKISLRFALPFMGVLLIVGTYAAYAIVRPTTCEQAMRTLTAEGNFDEIRLRLRQKGLRCIDRATSQTAFARCVDDVSKETNRIVEIRDAARRVCGKERGV